MNTWGKPGTEQKEEDAPPRFLAVHEYASMEWEESEELKAAVSTSWRMRVREDLVVKYERRIFKHHKSWERK